MALEQMLCVCLCVCVCVSYFRRVHLNQGFTEKGQVSFSILFFRLPIISGRMFSVNVLSFPQATEFMSHVSQCCGFTRPLFTAKLFLHNVHCREGCTNKTETNRIKMKQRHILAWAVTTVFKKPFGGFPARLG